MRTNSSALAAVTGQVTNLPLALNDIVCRLLSIYLLSGIISLSLLRVNNVASVSTQGEWNIVEIF